MSYNVLMVKSNSLICFILRMHISTSNVFVLNKNVYCKQQKTHYCDNVIITSVITALRQLAVCCHVVKRFVRPASKREEAFKIINY